MRALIEIGLVSLLVVGPGLARALVEVDRALLPGELWPQVGAELLLVPVVAAVAALLGRRPLRPDAIGVGAALGGLVALVAAARGFLPEGAPGVGGLLLAIYLGRLLATRLPAARWALAVAAVALCLPGWPARRIVASPPAAGPDRVVVLLTLDTFRADHLGKLGGGWFGVQTPHLDAVADQGLLYTEGVAPVALTLPSHTAMLTGRLPDENRVMRNGHRLADEAETVAEQLLAAGWRTGAFLGAAVLQRHGGLDQGFVHYDDLMGPWARWQLSTLGRGLRAVDVVGSPEVQRPGDRVVERALRWLEAQQGPTFLWVHLYDPHSPYAPPAPYDEAYDPTLPGVPGGPEDHERLREAVKLLGPMTIPMVPSDLRPSLAAYAGEITWTDQVVGRLLEGLPADAALVVAADHGESLVEHGYLLNHGWLVNQPSVRVPILVRAPGVAPGQVVDQPTPLTAIAPTLLELAGLPATGSLLDRAADPPVDELLAMYGTTQQARRMLSMQHRWRVGWRQGPLKWVYDERGEVRRYDLSTDPGELVDTLSEQAERDTWTVRSRERLEHLKEVNRASRQAEGQTEALRALGYVE